MSRRILFCSHLNWSRDLGGTKVQLELGDAMTRQGWACEYHSASDMNVSGIGAEFEQKYSGALRDFLRKRAGDFDVVEVGHEHLPFDRALFPAATLIVARSVLLIHHLESIRLPRRRTPRALARRLVYGRRDRRELFRRMRDADATIAHADVVNVSNRHDVAELRRRGVAAEKIVCLPFGLDDARRSAFAGVSSDVPAGPPTVAFVGTFDYRKGGLEFPELWRRIKTDVPAARLKLIGTRGLLRTADAVYDWLPADLHRSIEVLPAFDPADLPTLLADCHVGVFPSHFEGFGFGVLEMLAAALPVIAYDAPGPPEMIPASWLVPRGDAPAMAEKVVALLKGDASKLADARRQARSRAAAFGWDDIARRTIEEYDRRLRPTTGGQKQ